MGRGANEGVSAAVPRPRSDETGITELDAMIDSFLYGAAGGDTSWWSDRCGMMSSMATTTFKSLGFEAETAGADLDSVYADRTKDPANGPHAYTLVHLSGETYSVDFTAAQYGYYRPFPLVQQLNADGSWRRLGS